MIQWNNLSFEERIEAWSQHRNDIYHTDSTTAKVVVVSEFFRDIPICNRTLDYYTPENWPTPWEILHGSLFCKSGISLLIYYTLKINDPEADIDMTLIDDGSDVYVVPVVDGSVYNYVPGQNIKLEDISKEIKILQVIDNQKIKSI